MVALAFELHRGSKIGLRGGSGAVPSGHHPELRKIGGQLRMIRRPQDDRRQRGRDVVGVDAAASQEVTTFSRTKEQKECDRDRAALHTPSAMARAVFIAVSASSARDAKR